MLYVISSTTPPAFAGTLGGGGDGLSGCLGLGYLGPAVGVQADCQSVVPTQPRPQPASKHTNSQGYYWEQVAGPGYDTCPGGSAAQYWQEYDPQGKAVGPPEPKCPTPNNNTPPPPPPPAPPPPSSTEVQGEVPLPSAVIQFNPVRVGLTQLPTFFWAQGVGQAVHVSRAIAGYTITTDAFPIAYVWRFGDGATATSTIAGSRTVPSATHTYTRPGSYEVSVSIEYTGSFTYVGPDGSGTEPLGDYFSRPFQATYTVQQVRSVLVPTGAG
jgi:hypothetical protein